jgi:hypothetical protein
MDSLPARLARREALRARARVLSRVYIRAARALHRLWLRARATKAPADQEAYHAGLLVRAAKLDRFCGVLAEMQDGGDDSWVDLHRETKAMVDAACRAQERARLRPFAADVGVDQAPGWAFEGGRTDA